MRRLLLCIVLSVLCVGCYDVPARQQRAEEARRQQTQKELKELGEKMHNEQSGESESSQ